MSNKFEIAIDLDRVTDFFYWKRLFFLIPTKGRQWARQMAESLSYRVEDEVLHVNSGVVKIYRKSIPLRQITHVNLIQDPFARWIGIWTMSIFTAGSSFSEATLLGPTDAEVARDALLSSIQRVKETDTPSNQSV